MLKPQNINLKYSIVLYIAFEISEPNATREAFQTDEYVLNHIPTSNYQIQFSQNKEPELI